MTPTKTVRRLVNLFHSRPHRRISEEIRYMSAIASTPTDAEAKNATMPARLFFLDLSAGRILSANPDAPI
jgi:hypothetical protein